MNLLLIHCEMFSYSPKREAPKTTISYKDNTIRKPKYLDCLLVWISIEEDDKESKIEIAVKEITKVATDIGAKEIVLMPVSHMVPKPKEGKQALDWFLKIRELVISNNLKCYLEPFGYYGNWRISSKNHKKSVLGRWI